MPKGFQDLPPDLLASILAFLPCLKAKIRLATVAKGWRAALASSGSYSHGCPPREWGGHPFGTVHFAGPHPPVLQQDVLAALAASGIEFWVMRFKSWAWLPPTVRRLEFVHPPPADCPTLAHVEELCITFMLDCTALDVTRFPSARVLKASFECLDEWELNRSLAHLSQGAQGNMTAIPWLQQLVGLPQLTRVELVCGEFSPGRVLTQLPAGCELVVHTGGNEDLQLSKALPHCASLPHLVTLGVHIHIQTGTPDIDFSCLAGCPNLRDFWLSVCDYHGNAEPEDNLDWANLSTLNDVPTRCSVVLGFRAADIDIGSYEPPAGCSFAPYHDFEELICFRHDSQDCTAESDSCWLEYINVWQLQQAMLE